MGIIDFAKSCISTSDNQEMQLIPCQEKETSKRKMRKQINSLELQVITLEGIIKDELFKEFMAKLGEPAEINRLKK